MKMIFYSALLSVLTGCYPPTQTQYSPAVVEQPQSVHYCYGTLIDRRPASLEYGNTAGIGAAFFPTSPYLVGLQVAGNGPTLGIGAAFGGTAILAAGTIPSLPATEYTVCLNGGTYPPDPYLLSGPAPVIVVQNDYPDRHDYPDSRPNDLDMQPGTPVIVRVVGNSGRVMRRNPLLPSRTLSPAACSPPDRPMPVPLSYRPPPGVPAITTEPSSEGEPVKNRISKTLSLF